MALTIGVAFSSCGSDTGTASTGSKSSGTDRSIVTMLGELPASLADGDTPFQIAYSDLDAATKLSDLERPDINGDPATLSTWAQRISRGVPTEDDSPALAAIMPEAANPKVLVSIGEFRDETGWSLLDVGTFIEFQQLPLRFTVIDGSIDAADIDKAVGAATDGIWSVGDGDDFAGDLRARTAARPLGAPLRMAQHDGLFAVASSRPPVASWLADEPSLADNDALVGVAKHLDDAGAYSAYMLDSPGTETNPYDTIGVGQAVDDDGALGLFVYHYADEVTAKDAADTVTGLFEGKSDRTRAPWSDVFSSFDVAAEGDAVVVRVRFADERPPAVLWQILFTRDNLTA